MHSILRIFLGAVTTTLFVSGIAFAIGPSIMDQTSVNASPEATSADRTLEVAGSITQAQDEPGTSSREPLTSDEESGTNSDISPSVTSSSPEVTTPTTGPSTTSTSTAPATSTTGPNKATTTTTTSATTTRPPATTTTTTTSTTVSRGVDVVVWPGDDVGRLVGESPVGTVFLFKPGRYEGVSVRPKDGMVFVAEPGVIFDGLDQVDYAFISNAVDVTVQGFIVEGYASEFQQSAVKGATRWTIEDNEVRYNRSSGISSADGSTIRNNFVHHNGQIGIKGTGVGLVVEDNEISYNNTAGHPWKTATAEAGGTKFWRTTNLVVKNNYVHDNDGPGLWTDGRNQNTLIAGNLVEANNGPGIFYEISYSATIRDNKVYRNSHVGIWISASSDVEVKNNKVVDNLFGGISATQDDRGAGFYVENLWVHDNYIQMVKTSQNFWGWNGLQQQVGDDSYFTARNNRWDRNTYRIPAGLDRPFKWMNSRHTIEQWQDYGQDTNATFK